MTLLEQALTNVDKNKFMIYLCQNYPECLETSELACDVQVICKLLLERFGSEEALKIALKVMLEKGRSNSTHVALYFCVIMFNVFF